MKMFIGNLSHDVTDVDLREAFEVYGEVSSVKVIKDNFSGMSKGFGFVEMPNNSEVDTAMKSLNGEELKGQAIKVSEARPRSEKRRGRGRQGWGKSW